MGYKQLLKAKFSPDNGCHAEDGMVLSVVPRKEVPMKQNVSHHFVSTADLKTKSRYGWVQEVPEFTLEDFMQRYHDGSSEPALIEHVKRMLDSAGKLPVGTPMAADYSEKGFPPNRMEFTVHRVIFHD